MMGAVTETFLIAAFIILLGFAGNEIFERKGLPPYLFLIAAGIVLGPVLGIINGVSLLPILGIVAELTLMMVLLYSGFDINIFKEEGISLRTTLQVLLYVSLSIIIITAAFKFILGWTFLEALILGSIVGGETTAVVIVSLSKSLKIGKDPTTFIRLESALNSVLLVVLFLTFTSVNSVGGIDLTTVIYRIFSEFSVAIVIGVILSLLWLFILNKVKERPYNYVLTLGFALLTFAITDLVGGNPLLAVLSFGIILGNGKTVAKLFNQNFDPKIKTHLNMFQTEFNFILVTFFFVFLGLILVLSWQNVIEGAGMAALIIVILLAARYLSLAISTYKAKIAKYRPLFLVMCAQGVTPATLAVLAFTEGLPMSVLYLNIVTYVIIFTNVITTIGVFVLVRRGSISTKMSTQGQSNT